MKDKILNFINNLLAPLKELLAKKLAERAEKIKNAPPKEPSPFFIKLQKILNKVLEVSKKVSLPFLKIYEYLRKVNWGKVTPKKLIAFLTGLLVAAIVFAKNWFMTLKPITFVTFTGIGTFGTLIALNIYMQGQKIYDEGKEEIFGVEEKIQEATQIARPRYYKQDMKHAPIEDFIIPIYIKHHGVKRSLRISVTVESSNRYIKNFLLKNEHLVRDRVNGSIEPIAPEFQFSDEGKRILKQKIKSELNALLKELKVDGQIEKIYFHSIVAD